MAAFDLQDQEELDNFKRMWKSWGKWVFTLLVLIAFSYLGYVIYQGQQEKKDEQAAAVLAHLVEEANANNTKSVLQDLKTLQEDFPQSISTTQATLMAAATAFDEGKYDDAEKHLLWAQAQNKNALIDAQILQRLATIKLQQQKFDEALKFAQTKVADEYEVMMLELQGDIYVAKGDSKNAKAKYAEALPKADKELPGYELLQLKASQS